MSKVKEAPVVDEDSIPPYKPNPDLSDEENAKRKRFYEKSMALMGKIHLDLDIDEIRGRKRS